MEALVQHVVKPIVQHPDAVSLETEETDAVIMFRLTVHPDDVEALEGERGRTLRSIRNILSAAAGKKKASLEIVDDSAPADDDDDLEPADD